MHDDELFPDLRLHDDAELSRLLGSTVVERTLVHRWPLTRTDRVTLADGRVYAYKAQLPPSIEAEFYRTAASDLLLPAIDLGQDRAKQHLAIEWADAQSLHSADLTDEQFLGLAHGVTAEISGMLGPAYLDLSTPGALASAADITASRLHGLIETGRFALPPSTPGRVRDWAAGLAQWLSAAPVGLQHGDLSPEEVLLVDDGFRVLDWQRPVLGPIGVDLVSLIRFRKLDPVGQVDDEVIQVYWFLLLHWAALAAAELLPRLDPALPEGWARDALSWLK